MSSLAALLASRGATVRLAHDAELRRACRAACRCPCSSRRCPSELRRWRPLGAARDRARRARRARATRSPPRSSEPRALLAKNATLAELSVAIKQRRARGAPRAAPHDLLTPRQREVLELIVEGLDNAQIAARLGISERTARAHVSSVLERLGRAEPHPGRGRRAPARAAGCLTLALRARRSLAAHAAAAAAGGRAARPRCAQRCRAQMRAAGGGLGRLGLRHRRRARRVHVERRARRACRPRCEKLLTTATALDRLGPESRFETTVLATAHGRGRRARRRPLPARARATRRFGDAGARTPRARRSADAGVERDRRAACYGDESYLRRRRGGPASGFAISPLGRPAVGAVVQPRPRCARSARGFQTQPAAVRRRSGCRAARRAPASTWPRGAAQPDTRPPDARAARDGRVAAAGGARAPHEPGLRQLLRRDADQGPRRALRRRRLDRGGRARSRARSRASSGFGATGRRRLGPLARQRDRARATSAGCCSTPGASPGSTPSTARCRWPAQTGTLHKRMRGTARRGPLPREDRHADRRQRAGRLLPLAATATRSPSRC